MNIKILLLAISVGTLASCSTIYKSGQTPDDVYYSPARAIAANNTTTRDDLNTTDYEARAIHMSVYDPRWRNLDLDYNYDYTYSPYRYGYDYGYYYNPYYYPCPVYIKGVAISNPINTTPRMANLRTYSNATTVITNQKTYGTYQVNSRKAYTNSNSNTNSFIRRILNSAQSSNNSFDNSSRRSSDNNTRTYTPSPSSSSSSSSSSGSSSGSVSRPSRGH